MKIVIGSDHAGFSYKTQIKTLLEEKGIEVTDVGAYSSDSVDYPDIAKAAGEKMQTGDFDKAILICGSGVGVCVAVNKMKGLRAGICHDTYSAYQGVEHDDMNVLCMGERIIGIQTAKEIVEQFIKAEFSQVDRHKRRLNKVLDIEREQMK